MRREGVLSKGASLTVSRQEARESLNEQLLQQVDAWVCDTLQRPSSGDLWSELCEGQLLCRVYNAFFPDEPIHFHTKLEPFLIRDNIVLFLRALSRKGVPESELFDVGDLCEGKNRSAVLNTMLSLRDLCDGSGRRSMYRDRGQFSNLPDPVAFEDMIAKGEITPENNPVQWIAFGSAPEGESSGESSEAVGTEVGEKAPSWLSPSLDGIEMTRRVASQPVNVVSCGGNSYGQCGSGRGCETQTPVLLPTDWMSSGNSGRQRTISQIVAGANHTALIIDGELWMCGRGGGGQLGTGDEDDRVEPCRVEVGEGEVVTRVACGQAHTCVLTEQGNAYVFGLLKLSATTALETHLTPHRVCIPELGNARVVDVACGLLHTLFLTDQGQVYGWGQNMNGELALGDVLEFAHEPTLISSLHDIRHIACGAMHSCAVTADGRLVTFGSNHAGQLGVGRSTAGESFTPCFVDSLFGLQVVQVFSGSFHSIALTSDGALHIWGKGANHRLGLGSASDVDMPFPINMEDFGDREILSVSCGHYHNLAITVDGSLFGWGDNASLQLGHGPSLVRPKQLDLPAECTPYAAACGEDFSLVALRPSSA